MKNILTLSILFLLYSYQSKSQVLNWSAIGSKGQHMINVHTGLDFGLVYGLGYSYKLNTMRPVLLSLDASKPSGKDLFDDYKIKLGGLIHLIQWNNFQASAKLQGVFRHHQNAYVHLTDFGSDFSGTIGYYRSKWFVGSEFGFDKAIVTHFKHEDLYRENVPSAQDGWYEPSTGGNFYYGIQLGLTLGPNDFYIKVGKLITQDFKSTPFLPFYAQLGCSIHFGK